MKRHLFSVFFLIFFATFFGCGAPGINPPGNQNNNQNNNTSVVEEKGVLVVETEEEQVPLALRYVEDPRYHKFGGSGPNLFNFLSNDEFKVPARSYRLVSNFPGKITYLDLFYPNPDFLKLVVAVKSGNVVKKKILEPIGIGRAELQGLTCSGFTSTGWNYEDARGLNYEGNIDTGELFMDGLCYSYKNKSNPPPFTVDWKGRLNYTDKGDEEDDVSIFQAEFGPKKVDRKTWPGKSFAYYDINYRVNWINKKYQDGTAVYKDIECRCYNLKKEEE